jgi:hypothetical protein
VLVSRRCWLLPIAPVVTVACSSTPSGALQLITGEESDTFSRQPQPTTLQVDSVDLSGSKSRLATAPLPTSNVDLGSLAANRAGTIQVTGTGADGGRLMYGQSLPLVFGALDGRTIPIFVQRIGQLARMPPLPDARPSPTLALLGGRILLVGAGGDSYVSLTTQLYVFASLKALDHPPSLPRVPKSAVLVGSIAWLIDEGGATQFDFANNTQAEVSAPAGGAFSEIAGGATIYASDGSQYVVGATRTVASTKTVLAIDSKGASVRWVHLSDLRLGAAAAWVDGRGLVVAGGSETLPGVEIVGPGSATGSALCYPPDSSSGSGAVMLDGEHVLLAGGVTATGDDAGVRVIDLTRTTGCVPTHWAPLPMPLTSTQAFASDAPYALVVGSDQGGTTHLFRVTDSAATEVPTKAGHTGARAIVSPFSGVLLYGGGNALESYVP